MDKSELTKTEREVLNLLTEEFLTINQIAIRRKTSDKAVYKIGANIRRKGYTVPKYKQCHIVIECDEYCYFCDSNLNLHKHHIIRRKDEGLNEKVNLMVLCKTCHWLIHSGTHFLIFSNGYYYLQERRTQKTLPPTKRQMNFKRVPPRKSIDNAIKENRVIATLTP